MKHLGRTARYTCAWGETQPARLKVLHVRNACIMYVRVCKNQYKCRVHVGNCKKSEMNKCAAAALPLQLVICRS